MRFLVTGSNGLVGSRVCAQLEQAGHEVVAVGRGGRRTGGSYRYIPVDLTLEADVLTAIESASPEVIIHPASMTEVDACEKNPDLAYAANVTAAAAVAKGARRVGAHLVHVSTDYVFDGASRVPYDEDAEPNPINSYGRSKLAGEGGVASADPPHLIIRTSWVYSVTGAGFVASLLRDLPGKPTVRIVADQVGSPTWSRSLAMATAALVRAAVRPDEVVLSPADWGIYHLGGSGEGSRVEIAESVIDALGARLIGERPRIVPISAETFGALAPRPHYSALSNVRASKRFGITLRPWRAELHRMVNEEYR